MMAAIGSAIAGILFSVTIFESWFVFSASESGVTAYEYFLPGSSFSVVAPGIAESHGYAASGAGPVGALYEGILAVLIVLAILAFIGCTLAVLGAVGKFRNPHRYDTVWGVFVVVLIASVALVAIVPTVQPTLFGRSQGGCTGLPSGTNPCNSFWGSGNASGVTYSWGADVGWYLTIVAAAVTAVALALWWRTSKEPWGPGPPPVSATPVVAASAGAAGGGLTSSDVDRLLDLKRMLDGGQISEPEFQRLKSNLLGPAVPPSPSGTGQVSDELLRLKSLHDAGVLTDAEYEELRKRYVARL